MGNITFDQAASRKSADPSIDADLQQPARREQWLAENRSALEEYNRRIEARGTFSDGIRRF